jgi:hypothetical protein
MAKRVKAMVGLNDSFQKGQRLGFRPKYPPQLAAEGLPVKPRRLWAAMFRQAVRNIHRQRPLFLSPGNA